MRQVLGLPLVVVSTLVVLVIGVTEAWNGLATVADTGTLITAALLAAMLVAIIVRFTGDRSASWRVTTVSALALVALLLAAVMVFATFRAHTASDRFADRMDDFPLPGEYEAASASGVETRHQEKPEHVVRTWKVPTGEDACAAMNRAFDTWADPPRERFTRAGSCSASSNDQAAKAEAHVKSDGTAIVLEMWLEGAAG